MKPEKFAPNKDIEECMRDHGYGEESIKNFVTLRRTIVYTFEMGTYGSILAMSLIAVAAALTSSLIEMNKVPGYAMMALIAGIGVRATMTFHHLAKCIRNGAVSSSEINKSIHIFYLNFH
ncbi:hypothetical protein FY034_17245 (plasmid) [Trichlorobacter lovleyi]|uniref:hypothetical protein n=1 Tax=Trichlorobacter lovleyi TaxID=313985 RepID=UPI00223F80E3|nr:hypothetical protein [Trichlorobacter lovleyi]QOX80769.1 hypothetical protein FY034_17245 [Trichlorobacter lovleyi]